ncbi:hypothetical protein [Thermocoleostomius sinensis]|uniref:Uncharacterized protein n=1 Tax=Thermocoleostomius sinensis A174 TaxID=2016057 RepID=A0A9E8ZAY6_9CYAN|nr:hypothetical protein [Thermocoleostomius sinensis]WAL59859.1 hypothetical protein OXH18_22235 [Thermocoleostomius sinensis A174]
MKRASVVKFSLTLLSLAAVSSVALAGFYASPAMAHTGGGEYYRAVMGKIVKQREANHEPVGLLHQRNE